MSEADGAQTSSMSHGYMFNNNQQQQQQHLQQQQQQRVIDAKGEAKTLTDMTPILQHVKNLEENNSKMKAQIEELMNKNSKLSERTKQEMQKIYETVMAKFADALDKNDSGMKDKLLTGMQRLVENSAEDNGVWRMIVCASNLYERQTHELDQLRVENNELKERVNGTFGNESMRVGEKRKANDDPEPVPAVTPDIWSEFKEAFRDSF